jgi:signal transduction histidine kinase
MQRITENIYVENIYVLVILAAIGTFLLVISFLLLHIYNQNRLLKQQQLLQQTEIMHQKKLAYTIFASQEEERKRIGNDLHDSVGAALSALRMIIENIKEGAAPGTSQSFKQTSKAMIDKIIADTRNIAHNLSPGILSLYGFSEALAELADLMERSGKLVVNIDNEAENMLAQLPHQTALSVYRVLEELLNNTIRHAEATNVQIRFWQEGGTLAVYYRDDGKGFSDNPGKGMGLMNIRNRLNVISATYELQPAVEKGFSIRINIPS